MLRDQDFGSNFGLKYANVIWNVFEFVELIARKETGFCIDDKSGNQRA